MNQNTKSRRHTVSCTAVSDYSVCSRRGSLFSLFSANYSFIKKHFSNFNNSVGQNINWWKAVRSCSTCLVFMQDSQHCLMWLLTMGWAMSSAPIHVKTIANIWIRLTSETVRPHSNLIRHCSKKQNDKRPSGERLKHTQLLEERNPMSLSMQFLKSAKVV